MVEVDLTMLIGLFGAGALAAYAVVRFRLRQVRDVAKELFEYLDAVVKADEDSKVTEEEFSLIVKEAKELLAAVRVLVHPHEDEEIQA